MEKKIVPNHIKRKPEQKKKVLYHTAGNARIDSILANEQVEDALQDGRLDDAGQYLDTEAHKLLEAEMLSEYEEGHGSPDGFEDMLEEHLLAGVAQEESSDIRMYNRIHERLSRIQSSEARRAMLVRYAPEIMKGRERSQKLLTRLGRKLSRARELDSRKSVLRVRRTVSLKPKDCRDGMDKVHPGRTRDNGGGYPI